MSVLAGLVEDKPRFFASPPSEPCVWLRRSIVETHLPTLGDLAEVLEGVIPAGGVSVARDGAFVEKATFTRRLDTGEVIDNAKLAELFDRGSSIVINNLGRYSAQVREFTQELSREVDAPVGATGFITPEGEIGFSPHYDPNSLFVLQLEGSKTWRLWRPVVENPLIGQEREYYNAEKWRNAVAAAPDFEATLDPGDVLWLPRGWVHCATGQRGASFHVSLALKTYSYHWLVDQLVHSLAEDESNATTLREDLPLGWLADESGSVRVVAEGMRRFLEALPDVDVTSTVRQLARTVAKDYAETPSWRLPGRSVGEVLSAKTRVGIDHNYVRLLRRLGDGRLELVANDASSIIHPALADFIEARWFDGRGTAWSAEDVEDLVTAEDGMELVEELLRARFLHRIDPLD